jgi:hypothetical protein
MRWSVLGWKVVSPWFLSPTSSLGGLAISAPTSERCDDNLGLFTFIAVSFNLVIVVMKHLSKACPHQFLPAIQSQDVQGTWAAHLGWDSSMKYSWNIVYLVLNCISLSCPQLICKNIRHATFCGCYMLWNLKWKQKLTILTSRKVQVLLYFIYQLITYLLKKGTCHVKC